MVNFEEITGRYELNEKGQILTLETAKSLLGKRLMVTYPQYSGNEVAVFEITVGEIISEWDYAKRPDNIYPNEKYSSRQAYWASYMTPRQIREKKQLLCIIDQKGENTHVSCDSEQEFSFFDEPTFHCSDADRGVVFLEIK